MGLFAASLMRMRTEAGFNTAYAFFHKNGGRRVFPCTFPYYVRIERGAALPRPEWLPIFMALLRIPPTNVLWRQFIVDYLRDHFGSEEVFQSAIAPLLRPAEVAGVQQKAVRRLVSGRAYHVTLEQYKVVISDDAAYWCFELLVNERGALTPAELARETGESEADIKAALKRLSAAKLVKAVKGGRWKSPLSGMFYVFPPSTYPGSDAGRDKRRTILSRMMKRKGATLFNSGVVLSVDEASVRSSIGAFTDAMQTASAYCVYEKGEGTGMYQVETRIRRLLPF